MLTPQQEEAVWHRRTTFNMGKIDMILYSVAYSLRYRFSESEINLS